MVNEEGMSVLDQEGDYKWKRRGKVMAGPVSVLLHSVLLHSVVLHSVVVLLPA